MLHNVSSVVAFGGIVAISGVFKSPLWYIVDMLIGCLLYTSDAADEEDSGDLGGPRIIKKKKKKHNSETHETKQRQTEQ